MADGKFEFKSETSHKYRDKIQTGFCETNGLKCDWMYAVKQCVLHFFWKFDWNELKKKGIKRLTGYIIVKLSTEDCYSDNFVEQIIYVDLKESNQMIEKAIHTQFHLDFRVKFEFSLIPHYTQIGEVKKDSSSEQYNAVSMFENRDERRHGCFFRSTENLLGKLDEMLLQSGQTDAILIIDGKKIHVSKAFLAYHSEYFRNLFSLNDNDGKMNEIPIDGISVDDFELLLGSKPAFPTDDTVEKLVELADRFMMPSVIAHCEYYLLHNSKIENETMMWIGEKYGMSDLLEKSILEMNTIEKAKKWKQSPEYNNFSNDTKAKVFDRLI